MLRLMTRKNPACRILRARAECEALFSFPRAVHSCFLPYRKEVSYTVKILGNRTAIPQYYCIGERFPVCYYNMGAEGWLVCPPVFKTGMSFHRLGWVRFPPVPAKKRFSAIPIGVAFYIAERSDAMNRRQAF